MTVGNTFFRRFFGDTDFMVIDDTNRLGGWSAMGGYIRRTSPLASVFQHDWPIWGQITQAEAIKNSVVCRSGMKFVDTCGELDNKAFSAQPQGNPALSEQGRVVAQACKGDSGGPVYDEASHAALGTLSGIQRVVAANCNGPGDYYWFTWLDRGAAQFKAFHGQDIVLETAVPALLRVKTVPPLAVQILVDGEFADTWGLNWVDISPGPHEICFTEFEGCKTPPCQSVNAVGGQTSEVIGDYEQHASLRVITSPPSQSTITVNGFVIDDWGFWTDVPAGFYATCFGAVQGKPYSNPLLGCNFKTLIPGQPALVVQNFAPDPTAPGPPPPWGMLRVETDPPRPGRITINNSPVADRWGIDWAKLPVGQHSITFGPLQGFNLPDDPAKAINNGHAHFTINSGLTTQILSVEYIEKAWLRVVTAGQPGGVGATIYIRDLSIQNQGKVPRDRWEVWTDINPGTYEVCFGQVAGLTTPPCQQVTVVPGANPVVTGTYG